MPDIVQMHFLMLAVGECLKQYPFVSAQNVQDYIQQDESFGVRPPLANCRMALTLLCDAGFLTQVAKGENSFVYGRA